MRILIVDDEEVSLKSVRRLLQWRGIGDVEICDNGKEAIDRIRNGSFDIVLLDLLMPEVDGLQVIESAKPFTPQTEFIILTAVDDIPTTVRAIRMGAYDYLVKPVDNEHLFLSIERAYERKGLRAGLSFAARGAELSVPPAFSEIVTQCPRMKSILSYAHVMAQSGNPILITGESGTGKELVAVGVHRAGLRPAGPFVAVNVSAIPATMFESQFFGHAKGAFTGAETSHQGYFEQANGGTLFLDEIGELPFELQAKLLRVLEEKCVVALGSTKPIRVDVRIVSASNMDLDRACREGRFRLDLMYRLKSAHIHLPPLREREGDISLLAKHFLAKTAARYGKDISAFSPEALEILERGAYPGNVRELSQIVENAVLVAAGPTIAPIDLGMPLVSHARPSPAAPHLDSLKENELRHVAFVLARTKGNRREAARILGITVRQLQRKIAAAPELKKPGLSG